MSALSPSVHAPVAPVFQMLSRRSPPAIPPDDCISLWICLRGTVKVDGLGGPFSLKRRQYLTLPADANARFVPGTTGLGLMLSMPATLIAGSGRSRAGVMRTQPIFAFRSKAASDVLQQCVAALRHGANWDGETRTFRAQQLMRLALAAQGEIRNWLLRVPGRSATHRRNTLQRLLRARNAILNRPFEGHDLDSLALEANYSKCHFLRIFRDVFGETPNALLTVSRVAMAKALMHDSTLGIGEIASDVGYGSRCAFARMFKHQVGVSASNFRRSLDAAFEPHASVPETRLRADAHP